MKVALCFWGLTRSLKYTIYSIKKYILNVLKIHNIEYKIFLHTFVFNSSYYNPRAEEYDIQLDFNEYTLLEPDYLQIDNQDVIKDEINIMKYRTQPDPWDSDYICVDNFICAMYSKKQLGIMVQNSNIQFDYIVYLRPDVKYYTYFDKHYFSFANQYNVCTPNFHLYPKLNDRFCILQSEKLVQYSTMFDRLYDYSLYYPLHSEKFQYSIMVKLYKWSIRYVPFLFNRVRADGSELDDCNRFLKKTRRRKELISPIIENDNKVVQPLFKMKS